MKTRRLTDFSPKDYELMFRRRSMKPVINKTRPEGDEACVIGVLICAFLNAQNRDWETSQILLSLGFDVNQAKNWDDFGAGYDSALMKNRTGKDVAQENSLFQYGWFVGTHIAKEFGV